MRLLRLIQVGTVGGLATLALTVLGCDDDDNRKTVHVRQHRPARTVVIEKERHPRRVDVQVERRRPPERTIVIEKERRPRRVEVEINR